MPVSLSPVWNGQQFFDNNGFPLSGGKIFTYADGSSSILQATYSDMAGTVPNTDPIVLDSSGRLDVDIWLIDGLTYRLTLTKADGTTVLQVVDGVTGSA